MNAELKLEASPREQIGKQLPALRRSGSLPAVVYGHGSTATAVSVPYAAFEKLYPKAGESSLIDLSVSGKPPVKVLIQEVQRDAVSGTFLHVDFHEVKLTEKLTTDVALHFIGEAKAVKELGGVLVKTLDQLTVECLAKDLVHEIDVDISSLATFEDVIRVKDIILPAGMTTKVSPDEVVATVQPPRSEAEMKALEEAPVQETAEVEVAEKGKKKDEEAVEGEADASKSPEATPPAK